MSINWAEKVGQAQIALYVLDYDNAYKLLQEAYNIAEGQPSVQAEIAAKMAEVAAMMHEKLDKDQLD